MAIDLRKIDPELNYPLKQVAQLLEVSYGTVLKLRKQEKLRSMKIGKKFYVQGREILKYINNG
jgi:excisionase family DNA binding protein